MARLGIVFGLLLCGLTIAGMSATTEKNYTQFVPMMFGIPMLFLGVVSLNPHRRRESVFFALILSLVAVSMGAGRLVVLGVQWVAGEYVNPISLRLVLVMTLLSLVFVVIAHLWRRRRAQTPTTVAESSEDSPPSEFSEDSPDEPSDPEGSDPLNPTDAASPTKMPKFSDNPYQSPPIVDAPADSSQNPFSRSKST